MPTVNSVLGPLDTTALGFTLMHEHILMQSPNVKENFPVMDREREIEGSRIRARQSCHSERDDILRRDEILREACPERGASRSRRGIWGGANARNGAGAGSGPGVSQGARCDGR